MAIDRRGYFRSVCGRKPHVYRVFFTGRSGRRRSSRRGDLIDQVRGALRHAATATAWKQRAALAGESEAIEPTRATAKAREAARQPTALEKVRERPLHKGR